MNKTGKIAFLYPGQGAQKAGMGKDFYERDEDARRLYDSASELLNLDMAELCFTENSRLDLTEYTQAALVTTSLAMTAAVVKRGLKADVAAGLSLGEYSAVAAAGGLSAIQAIGTVRKRGILMQEAVPPEIGTMAAITGLDAETVTAVTDQMEAVSIANYNCPGQVVITGLKEAVAEAGRRLSQAGARRVVMLNVSGPFHSPFLAEAGTRLEDVLASVAVAPLHIPYVSNVTGAYVTDSSLTKALLAAQVSAPVRWQQGVEAMIRNGVDTMVEIGPGKTLTGFLKRIDKAVTAYNIATWEDMERVVQELEAKGLEA